MTSIHRFTSRIAVISAVCGLVLFAGVEIRAATFNATIGSTAVTIVETDPFPDGGAAGNTVKADDSGTFWSNIGGNSTDGLWTERVYSDFFTGYEVLAGATNRTFEISGADLTNAPALRTSVSGLAPGLYEVFEVYTSRADNNSDDGGTRAVLNDTIANGTDYRWEEATDSLASVGGTWSTSIASLGVTAPGATDFFVEVAGKSGTGRSHHVGVAYRISTTPVFQATVDRDFGTLTLSNVGGGAASILGYSFTSAVGALDQTGWDSIEDQGLDTDDAWIRLTAADVHTDLSEAVLGGPGPGDGVSLASLSSIDFGDAWIQYPTEDVQFKLLLDDGTVETIGVKFTGNGGESFVLGDLDFSGGATPITAADWIIYRDKFQTDLSGLSLAESYAMGDLDGDADNDWDDFDQFKILYNAANGTGSFEAMLSAVPEPSSLALLSLSGLTVLWRRRI